MNLGIGDKVQLETGSGGKTVIGSVVWSTGNKICVDIGSETIVVPPTDIRKVLNGDD